jgi:signal transduction histidine kinase
MPRASMIYELLTHSLNAANPPSANQVDAFLRDLAGAWPAKRAGVVLRLRGERMQYGNHLSGDDLERIGLTVTEVSERDWGNDRLCLVPLQSVVVGRDCFLWLVVDRQVQTDEPLLRLLAAAVVNHFRTPPSRHSIAETLDQRLDDLARVAGRIAHDFDNILTGVLGFADLALTQLPQQHPAASYIHDLLRVAQRGLLITQQMHQFSKANTIHTPTGRLDVAMRNQEAKLKESITGKYRLLVGIPADLPTLALDNERLELILSHLLNNALEATPISGTITVSAALTDLDEQECRSFLGTARPGSFVTITISDTGSGISADVRKRLFVEPFFTTKTRRRGLGLVTIYRILAAHGGGIRIEPPTDQGTRVTVAVPVV